ncbi:MAG: ABC transporter permease subunit [Clostridiales bacterium]|jgi:putative aldouronate transport system permease protein|nr:ABC transporter permease subunit [Clostridiales bacterium]
MNRTDFVKKVSRQRFLLFMIIPGIVYFVVFHYIPMYGVVIAFKNFDVFSGIWDSPWVGLSHFKFFAALPYFWQVVGNTLKISALKIFTGFPCPILLALLLNELYSQKFKKVVQTISYLPHFLSWIVISGVIFQLLSISYGFYGYICAAFGREPSVILSTKSGFMSVLITSNIWKEIGYGSIIYLASIAGISPELYESAVIDGAGRFKQCLYITLPSLSNIIAVMLVLAMGGLLSGSFDQIFNLQNAVILPYFDTIDTYVYRMGIQQFQYSFSAAVGLARSIIGIILVLSCNWVVGKFANYTVF